MLVETIDSTLDLDYAQTFASNNIVVVMRNSASYVDDLRALKDKKIAIIKNYGYVARIKQDFKELAFYEVDNIQEGLSERS